MIWERGSKSCCNTSTVTRRDDNMDVTFVFRGSAGVTYFTKSQHNFEEFQKLTDFGRVSEKQNVCRSHESNLEEIHQIKHQFFITAPIVKLGRDQHMAILLLLLFSHLLDQSKKNRIIKAPL
jgi:hypothetical protein